MHTTEAVAWLLLNISSSRLGVAQGFDVQRESLSVLTRLDHSIVHYVVDYSAVCVHCS